MSMHIADSPTSPNRTTARLSKQDVLDRLDERSVRRVYEALGVDEFGNGGRDNWLVRSPLRDDQHPSFSIQRQTGAWHDKATGQGGSIFDAVMLKRGLTFGPAMREVAASIGLGDAGGGRREMPSRTTATPAIAATYPYCDEAGELLYEIVRWEPGRDGGSKSFSARRPAMPGEVSRDGWIWKIGDVRRVLYRLPELVAADTWDWVYLCEGEKDADRLAELGVAVTTAPGGATKWHPDYTASLAGRPIVILPDNDDPGRDHAALVARALLGCAASVRVVNLPDLPHKGDVSDWLDAGGTTNQLEALTNAAPAIIEIESLPIPTAHSPRPTSQRTEPTAVITWLSDVTPQPVQWLWERWLPKGKVSILGGHPGVGKSTIAVAFAAMLSNAGNGVWPDETPAPAGRTLFLIAEDGVADTLHPRLTELGADLTQVGALEAVREGDGSEVTFSLANHLSVLERRIIEDRIDLVVIDPLSAFLPNANRNDEGEVRDLLTPLGKLADRLGVAILGIMHVGKPTTARRTALQSLLGATAFGAFARTVLMIGSVPGSERAIIAVVKSNLARKPLPIEWSREENGAITWHGPTDQDPEALLGGIPGAVRTEPRDDAEAFLREMLADGPVLTRDVEEVAAEQNINTRTLDRVRKLLGVRSRRLGSSWYLTLPDTDWDDFVRGEVSRAVAGIREAVAPDEPPQLRIVESLAQQTCLDCGEPCGSALRCSACATTATITRMHCRECSEPLSLKADRERGACYKCVTAAKHQSSSEREAAKAEEKERKRQEREAAKRAKADEQDPPAGE